MSEYQYEGNELTLFAEARRWKSYVSSFLSEHIRGDVLEVGAGLGAMTQALRRSESGRWLCLEPDPQQADRLSKNQPRVEVRSERLCDLATTEVFDTILYIDVLEHIENDAKEVNLAFSHLAPGGQLVVLCPAHQFLYSAFDEAVGHYRRYDRSELKRLSPGGGQIIRSCYLDAAGLLASLGNRCLLRQAQPTRRQIAFWDNFLVPVSRWLDPVTQGLLGKSVVVVWQKPLASGA